MFKVLIALSTFNRKNLTEISLKNLCSIINKDENAELAIYDDGSDKYDINFLKRFSNLVLRFPRPGGVERSRARAFRDFVHVYKDFQFLYITDNDTIHDVDFLKKLRETYDYYSIHLERPCPVGLFNSRFHMQAENILNEDDRISMRKTCPGVSQFYDRKMVEQMVKFIDENPVFETLYGFDYYWPMQLKLPFLQSKVSYLEHFSRDKSEPGMHSKITDNPKEDFERDRAINPTNFLKNCREDVIEYILYEKKINHHQYLASE